MSEKIDELIESNAEITKSNVRIEEKYRSLVSLIKGFIAGCSIVIILFITFMIQTREDIATIKSTLVTTENIVTLRAEIRAVKDKFHNELGAFLTLNSYIAIEAQRSITVAELFYLFGKEVHVKDEELEKFRNTAIFKLNNNVKLGTAPRSAKDGI